MQVTQRFKQPPALVALLGVYLLTRLAVLAATGVVHSLQLSGARCGSAVPARVPSLANCWDAHWFVNVATQGYPSSLPGPGVQTTLAFFPGYPALIAAGHALGLPALATGIAISLIAGAVATLLVWRLALLITTPAAAFATAVLFATFPGSVVLSWAYSEALAVALATGALLLLHQKRWAAGGLVAALAGTTRGDVWVAVTIAALVAVTIELRRDDAEGSPGRDRRSLLALALAPLGGLGYLVFLWIHTGTPTAWTTAQSRGWDQHMDWGTHAVNTVGRVLTHPLATPSRAVQTLALLLLAGGVVALVKKPVPGPWLAYVVVIMVISLTSNQVGFRPRAELLAVPVFVAVGAWLRPPMAAVVAGAMLVAQALLVVLWLGAPLIFPP